MKKLYIIPLGAVIGLLLSTFLWFMDTYVTVWLANQSDIVLNMLFGTVSGLILGAFVTVIDN